MSHDGGEPAASARAPSSTEELEEQRSRSTEAPPLLPRYLSEEDLPDELAPLGVRWAAGWGYMLSRDLAEFVTNTALMYAAVPEK